MALAERSLSADAIAYTCNMDCIALRQRLDFLLNNGLVDEKIFNKGARYNLTRRGLAIFKTLVITKRLEKLQNKIKMIDEALQTIPAFSELKEEKTKRPK